MTALAVQRKIDWLVVIPDKPNTQELRVEIRELHMIGSSKNKETGVFKLGGAILEDMPVDDEIASWEVCGSTLVVSADSKESVVKILADDVYVKMGVWDLDKALIWPVKIGFGVSFP